MCIRSGSFAKLLRRPFHNFLHCALSHRATRFRSYVPQGCLCATCAWSHVHIESGPVRPCGPVPFAVTAV